MVHNFATAASTLICHFFRIKGYKDFRGFCLDHLTGLSTVFQAMDIVLTG